MKQKIKNYLINFLVLLTTLIIIAILLEIGIRLAWKKSVMNGYGYPNELFIADKALGYRYKSNFRGKFKGNLYNNIPININSKGLRDVEHSYKKPPGYLRFLTLGDSITFGPGVNFNKTFLRLLELKFQNSGKKVEIIKAGINGYEFDQQYSFYFNEGYKYSPDVVFIGICLNDPQKFDPKNYSLKRNIHKKEKNESPKKKTSIVKKQLIKIKDKFLYLLLIHYRTYEFLKYSYSQMKLYFKSLNSDYNKIYFNHINKLWQDTNWNRYSLKLTKFNDYLKKRNIRLVLILFPYKLQFKNNLNLSKMPQKKMKQLSKKYNIHLLNLIEYLDVENYNDYYLMGDDVHLSEKGHSFVTEIIFKEIIKESLPGHI